MRAFNETKTVRGSCLFGTQLAKGRRLRAFNETTTLRGSCLFGTAACEGTPHAGLQRDKRRSEGAAFSGPQLAKGRHMRAFAGRSCGPPTSATSNHVPTVHRPKLRPAALSRTFLLGMKLAERPYRPMRAFAGQSCARRAIACMFARDEACGAPVSTDAGLRARRLRPADPARDRTMRHAMTCDSPPRYLRCKTPFNGAARRSLPESELPYRRGSTSIQ